MKRSLLVASFFSFLVTACVSNDPGGTEAVGAEELVGEWAVEEIGERPVIDRSPAHLVFEADGTLAGNATVNQLRGSWHLEEGRLVLSPLAVTMRAGPPASMEQEQRLLDVLGNVARASVERGLLHLADAEGRALVRASRRGDATRTIQGSATYRERIALTPGHMLEVTLEDVSRADGTANVVARTSLAVTGQVPIAFELSYDPARIRGGQRYVVRAKLIDPHGELAWTSDTAVPVLEGGPGGGDEPVTIVLRRATR